MTRWPLLLPPSAVLTSPLRSRRSSSSIVVKSPSRHSSPSSCCRAVHRRSACRPSPSIRHRAVHCHLSPLCSLSRSHHALSLAVEEPSCRPSPSRSCRAAPRRRGAIAPSIAIEEPSCRTSPSRSHCPCRLTTPATRLAPQASRRPAGCRVASPHAAVSHLPAPLIAAIAFRASCPSG